MNGWWRLALLAIGASLGLPAAVLPAAQVYSIHVPGATRVETHIAHTVGWDVSVTFNPQTCQVLCEYRRKTGNSSLFLLPVVEILAYIDGASRPIAAAIDPAGAALPRLAAKRSSLAEPACLGGRTAETIPAVESAPLTSSLTPPRTLRREPAPALFTARPLRI